MSSKRKSILHSGKSKEIVGQLVGTFVKETAERCIKARGRFTVAVSGGSLPKLLMSAQKTHFSSWFVVFADERCVATTHVDSNCRNCEEAFLNRLPIPQSNICKIDDALVDSPTDAAHAYEISMLEMLGSDTSLDLILLGMGEDGHTCSLFPGHELLKENTKWVAPILDSPKSPPRRITLTYPCIHSSRCVCFVAAGSGKAEIFPSAFSHSVDIPAGRAHAKDGLTHWFTDDLACSKLKNY
eukprot:GSMAST32.ASY1.ANO1.596.1 assembled CDS